VGRIKNGKVKMKKINVQKGSRNEGKRNEKIVSKMQAVYQLGKEYTVRDFAENGNKVRASFTTSRLSTNANRETKTTA
jgi:hypothetical protein